MPLIAPGAGHLTPIDAHRAGGWMLEASDQVQERGLPAAARPQHRNEFAATHAQVQRFERMNDVIVTLEGFRDVPKLNQVRVGFDWRSLLPPVWVDRWLDRHSLTRA